MKEGTYPLAPCPGTPNCVSSDPNDPNRSRSLPPLRFAGSPEAAIDRLADVLAGLAECRIVERGSRRLRCEFRSRVFRFVDEVELVAVAGPSASAEREEAGETAPGAAGTSDEGGVVHFRSASRLGHWDLGANRRRIDRLRRLFEEADRRP